MKKFTLIEMLIVIAVIGLLVSILIPSLAKARTRAQIAVCLSNLKQQNVALAAYMRYNSGILPYAYGWAGLVGHDSILNGGVKAEDKLLNKYLSSYEACECPLDKGSSNIPDKYIDKKIYEVKGSSYVHMLLDNKFMTRRGVNSANRYPMFAWTYEYPEKKLFLTDAVAWGGASYDIKINRWHRNSKRRFSVLWLDGHASEFTFPYALDQMKHVPVNLEQNGWY